MKMFKKISALLLALILVCALSATAFADSRVEYKGGAEKFLFFEGSEYTDSDLFGGFKNVFPGDELRQTIKVKNGHFGPESVKIYMRAIAHDETNPLSPAVSRKEDTVSMTDFLSKLHMTVSHKGKVIFDASPAELDGFKNNVLLGEFASGSSTELLVTLSVPIELGNEYANRVGEVDWVFTAEELSKPITPVTGDDADFFLWSGLMCLSLAAAVIILSRRKTQK